MPRLRRASASGRAAPAARVPSIFDRAGVGSTSPSRARANVVLPLPDSPTRPSVSPGQSDAETPASALMSRPSCLNVFASLSIVEQRASRRARRRRALDGIDAVSRGSVWARSWNWQRLWWPSAERWSSGFSRAQRSSASPQRCDEDAAGQHRADRRQEAGDRVELAAVLAEPAARDAAEQADGVGVPRVLEDLLGRPFLDELARRRGRRPFAASFGSAPRLWLMKSTAVSMPLLELGDRGRAPRPRPSRRGRSSARRGSGGSGRSRAPSRSRPAAASRRRAGAGSAGAPSSGSAICTSRERGDGALARLALAVAAQGERLLHLRPTRSAGFSAAPGFW